MSEIELPEFPPELPLVIACSRWPLNASDEQEIRTRATAKIDWNQFLAWVQRNRVAPLVYHNLQRAGCPSVPEAAILKLQSQTVSNGSRLLMQIAEAARISRMLVDAGIRSMVIKGPVLGRLAFGDPMLRESGDIDLVIEPTRVPEADRVIAKAGCRRIVPNSELAPRSYRAYLRRRCQFGYHLEARNISLELHWRLTTNSLLMPLDATSWSRSEPVCVAGVSFATLPDEDLFLYLCVHGSVHIWFRLKWLADIAALLRQWRPEVIVRIAKRARDLEVDRSFHQAMILAHVLMAAPVPPEVLANACGDAAARRLAFAGCQALNWHGSPEEPIRTQWFSAWVNWHAFGLRSGLPFRWEELQNQMFSPEDWARVRLPERLFFLYLPLRPLSWVTRHFHRLVNR